MKVIELAKKLGTTAKELIKFLESVDIKVKSQNSKLDPKLVSEIKSLFEGERASDVINDTPPKEVFLNSDRISIQNLAQIIDCKLGDLMKAVLGRGLMLSLNSEIDFETAKTIVSALNIDLKPNTDSGVNELQNSIEKIEEEDVFDSPDLLVTRPPVITIMGHVDHGKTALLDTIRKSNIVSGESGGITQHIGAYQVSVKDHKLTFLDTPGHAAFTTLRARGAQVTDIVILVVAGDEGIKPQTVEAIHHAQAAKVPIIVAVNKMDKPEFNIDNVKTQLSEHNLLSEDWGGKTIITPISAKHNKGISDLLEMVLLTAEMLELKANASRLARGVVIESKLSKKKGATATILIKSGTLRVGDHFVIDNIYGKVRALLDDHGEIVKAASPGMPVELLGIADVPIPGSILESRATEKECKEIVRARSLHIDEKSNKSVSFESLSFQMTGGNIKQMNLIIKSDVHGSLEAILSMVEQSSTDEVALNVVHSGTGQISENDVMLARASNALIIGFNVDANNEAQRLAKDEGIEIKTYDIIYEIIDDIENAMNGLFSPQFEEIEIGRLEVRQLFSFSKVGTIAGSYVLSGKIVRNGEAKVFRDEKEIFKGKIASLKRFKEDVKEVAAKFECGIVLKDFDSLTSGDVIVCYQKSEKKRK